MAPSGRIGLLFVVASKVYIADYLAVSTSSWYETTYRCGSHRTEGAPSTEGCEPNFRIVALVQRCNLGPRRLTMKASEAVRLISLPDGRATLEVAGRPMFELNSVGAMIWKYLQTGSSTREIIDQIVERFKVPEPRATKDVTEFVELLTENLLVFNDEEFTAHYR